MGRHKKQHPISELAGRIGLNVFKLRGERNWTLNELAERVGVSTSHLCNIENGRVRIHVDLLWKIARAFGVSLTYFLIIPQDGK